MSGPLPPATQAPPIKTKINDSGDGDDETMMNNNTTASTTTSPHQEAPSTFEDMSSQTEKLTINSPNPIQSPPQQQPQSFNTATKISPAQSSHLLDDPKLQEILMSDVGATSLLARLKQSIASAREFSTFVKKKGQLESENQQAMKKLTRATRESIKKPEGRQGTFVSQFDEIVRANERVADVGSTFVAALHVMSDELGELARTCEKTRKSIKERCLREEKNVSDAEQMAEKAKHKYDSLAEDFERMRTGDPTKNRFGFKQSKTAQHEEELHRKVTAAESEYKQRVDSANRSRSELVTKLRPVTVRELKNLIMECDSGISLQLAKYANLNETLALNSGFIVSPLKPEGSGTAPLTMKEVASKVDNELDFYKYVMAIPKTQKLNRAQVNYRQHPAMASAYPQSQPPRPLGGSNIINSSTNNAASSPSTTMASPQPPQPSPQPPTSDSMARSTSGASSTGDNTNINSTSTPQPLMPQLSPQTTTNTTSGFSSIQYPPGTTSTSMPVYGVPLEELLDYEEGTVPRIVFQCIQAVDAFGLEVEGIYRQTGNSQQAAEIQRLFDTDSTSVDLLQPSANLNDIHSVASALKLYFRKLPDPLLTKEFHSEFLDAARIENDVQRRDAIHATINKLPDANYSTLRYLVFHLYRVQEREAINRMSIDNLGIVWGPTLMATDYNNVEGMAIQGRIIATVIYNAYTIFDAD